MDYHTKVGGFEIASLHVNHSTMPVDAAENTMRLFSQDVMPRVAKEIAAAREKAHEPGFDS